MPAFLVTGPAAKQRRGGDSAFSTRRHPIDEIEDLARDAGIHRADRQQLRHMIVPEALSEAGPDVVLLDELGEERGMGRQVSRVVVLRGRE